MASFQAAGAPKCHGSEAQGVAFLRRPAGSATPWSPALAARDAAMLDAMGETQRLPIDHPDFFDLPPPPGRSRESSIVLDAEGRFWDHGELVTHRGMQDAFATWIRRHPRDGRFVLCNGYDWTYFRVEDVPFFVRGLGGSLNAPTLVLTDQTEEPFDPARLWVGPREALYCRVKGGDYVARFTPSAQAALEPYVAEGNGGVAVFRLAGRDYLVTHANERVPTAD
jgi:uncharacterized protein